MGPIRRPHAFELEPVIAADIGLVDECLRLPVSRKNGRSVAASRKNGTSVVAMEKQVTLQPGQP
jgi:hypothetical protein